jgi:AcrR family transcriptional regulator
MAKAETIDALMESAIQAFSQFGYEGASLRDIASDAGVPLSTIHMYFGSKSELYGAVEQKAWAEIDNERSILLHEALAKHPDGAPELADLIYALALPVVRRALGTSRPDMARIHLIRSRVAERSALKPDGLLEVADRSMIRWIDAMTISCPTLSRQDIVWAFSFVVGALYSWQLIDHRYDGLLGQDVERTVDDVTADIVAFGCAGVQSMIERRAKADLRV